MRETLPAWFARAGNCFGVIMHELCKWPHQSCCNLCMTIPEGVNIYSTIRMCPLCKYRSGAQEHEKQVLLASLFRVGYCSIALMDGLNAAFGCI